MYVNCTSLLMRYELVILKLLSESPGSEDIKNRAFFKIDYLFSLNKLLFQ